MGHLFRLFPKDRIPNLALVEAAEIPFNIPLWMEPTLQQSPQVDPVGAPVGALLAACIFFLI